MAESFEAAGLSFKDRGILIAAAASTLGDPYCSLAWGNKLAGESDGEVAASVLRGEDQGLDERERALARWARAVARDPNGTTPAHVETLRAVGYDDGQVLAITAFVALRLAFATVNDALGRRAGRRADAVRRPEGPRRRDLGALMDSLALVFSSGWASGINAYLVVLVLGIADRVNDFSQIPDVLGRWEVLAVAFVMYAMEFVADKIPYIDSTWDAISTAIRPTVGAVLGVLLAGEADSLGGAVAAVVGGGTALASHAVKMGSRLALNSSPEPVSNIAASVAEDVAVLGVVWFAIEHPVAAASIAAVLLVAGLAMLYFLVRLVRRGVRRWRRRRDGPPAYA